MGMVANQMLIDFIRSLQQKRKQKKEAQQKSEVQNINGSIFTESSSVKKSEYSNNDHD